MRQPPEQNCAAESKLKPNVMMKGFLANNDDSDLIMTAGMVMMELLLRLTSVIDTPPLRLSLRS